MTTIPIQLVSDEKGYFDRECPNEECRYTFKILMNLVTNLTRAWLTRSWKPFIFKNEYDKILPY